MVRTVSIYGTDSSKRLTGVQLPDEVKTFGDFSRFIANLSNGFSLGNSKVTWLAQGDPLNGSSPDDANAGIPSTEKFMVALTPHTANKGAAGYTEMRDFIKAKREEARSKNDMVTYNLIGNYTNKNLQELNELFVKLQQPTTASTSSTAVHPSSELSNIELRVSRLEVKLQELQNRLVEISEEISNLSSESDDEEREEINDEEETDEDDMPDEIREFYTKRNIPFND